MRFDEIAEALADVSMTKPKKARVLYDAVLEKQPERILELGFHQGVSTCYLAAALDELGRGSIVTMDRVSARDHDPNIFQNLERFGLSRYVTPVFAQRSFTWELAKLIRDGVEEPFDFVFHDGGHNWDVAGYCFFLSDKLSKPGTWMLFDDLQWTHESPSVANSAWVKAMSEDERTSAHVSMVYELLVKQHPDYGEFSLTYGGGMGWARKGAGATPDPGSMDAAGVRASIANAVGRTRRVARRSAGRARRKARSVLGRS